jgi:hypothetical protein
MTAPAPGAVYTTGDAVNMSAQATDSHGVASVQFYVGATLLGTDTTAPYSFTWANVPSGAHSLTARAVDVYGAAATSAPISITVLANAVPTVALTSPASGSTYAGPASIAMSATASDSDGTVDRVEFYAGTSLLSTDTTAPYAFTWNSGGDGVFSLTAQAVDNRGARSISNASTVTVARLATSVAAVPASVVTGQPSTITVSGSPVCGAMEINYGDGTGQVYAITGLPFSQTHTWSTAGSKTITAIGHGDCGGQVTTSLTVTANSPPLVSLTAPAPGTAYTTGAAVNVSAYATDSHGVVSVQFYAGATLLGTDTTAPYSVTWANVPSGAHSLTARAVDIYGAAATSAPVSIAVRDVENIVVSPATLTSGDAGTVTVVGSTSCGAVTIDYGDGSAVTYALAGLPVSQSHVWSTGGWKLITATGQGNCVGQASTWLYVNWRPSLTLTSPANNDTAVGPASIQVQANASDADGYISYVAFWGDGVLLAVDYAAPYAYSWNGVGVGTHSIVSASVDNSGAAQWASASVNVVDPGPARLTSLVVSPNPIPAGQSAAVTVFGTNPCGALQINFGDSIGPFTPISQVPYSTTHIWAAPGTYTVTATGHGNCSGQVSTTVVVQ